MNIQKRFGINSEFKKGVIIQARMGSSRFPGKVMADVNGKPLLERLIDNLKLSKNIDEIVVATTDRPEDIEIESLAKRKQVLSFRGDENDVLKRFLDAAEFFHIDLIIRVCADCPLADPYELDNLIESHLISGKEYTTNSGFIHKGLPFRLEIFSADFLKKLNILTKDKFWREHVTDVIINHRDQFDINLVEPEIVRPDLELDIDEPKDLEQMKGIYKALFKEGEIISAKNVVEFIEKGRLKGDSIAVVIPSHLASNRFERKALVDIEGLPMIVHVFKRAELAKGINNVYVATCDEELKNVVEKYGGKVIMTSNSHKTGSDRIAEAAVKLDADIIINVQGDEPLVYPEEIELVARAMIENPEIPAANLICLTDKRNDIGEGKVIFNKNKEILYYSREDIPTVKRNQNPEIYKFCGIFGFRKDFLLKYAKMEQTPLEKAEFFEYNRIIENGHKIKAVITDNYSMSVDYPEDLEEIKVLMAKDNVKFQYLK